MSIAIENFVKAIYNNNSHDARNTKPGNIAKKLGISNAAATDMAKKLAVKELLHYQKYQELQLTDKGKKMALNIVRKHRLWETFLSKKLHFNWDEVHEVAEQLEHIRSSKLIDRLDEFLGFPEFDPHGDPIPNANGDLPNSTAIILSDVPTNQKCKVVAVKDASSDFLKQLARFDLKIGTTLHITERMPFDNSLLVKNGNDEAFQLSEIIASKLMVV